MEPFFWTAAKSWLADRWSNLTAMRHERSFPLPPCGRNGAESDQYATLQNHSVTRSASLHSDKQGLSDLEEKESEGQSDLDFQAGITQAFASPKVDQSTALEKAASEVSLVSEGEDPFAALPDELLALILRKCEPEAFLSAWQVSPRWRGVASQEAAPLFNAKPRQGIAFLMQTEAFQKSDAVARFLLKGADLDRGLIGDYLGDRTPRCDRILRAYLELFDFAGLDIEDALESFLGGFDLPNLAHKRKRILRRFGERYLQCNPGFSLASGSGGSMEVELEPPLAADLAMCLLDLRASVVDRSLSLEAHMSASRERFLKWAYVRLPGLVLGKIHDRVMAKLAVRKTES